MGKKVALMTFHNAANYGAILQTYALQAALEAKGYDAQYIDYVNENRRLAYDMTNHVAKALKSGNFRRAIKYALGASFMGMRKNRFAKFSKQYLHLTPKTYTNSADARELNRQFDKFIIGSDQVWNPKNNGGDMAFLLDFVEVGGKRISYSSSFGIASIPDEYRERYVTELSKFGSLAVRESKGVELVKELTGRDAKLVLDPVFLLNKDQWMNLTEETDEKYIFSYFNESFNIGKFLRHTGYDMKEKKLYKLSRSTNLKDFLSSQVKVKYTMSPTDFLTTIRNAETIVTTSFHCLSLSILLNKPFVVILLGDKGLDERITTLLHHFGLEGRIYTDNMTVADIQKPIDYEAVNAKIEALRKDSMDYLINSIEL